MSLNLHQHSFLPPAGTVATFLDSAGHDRFRAAKAQYEHQSAELSKLLVRRAQKEIPTVQEDRENDKGAEALNTFSSSFSPTYAQQAERDIFRDRMFKNSRCPAPFLDLYAAALSTFISSGDQGSLAQKVTATTLETKEGDVSEEKKVAGANQTKEGKEVDEDDKALMAKINHLIETDPSAPPRTRDLVKIASALHALSSGTQSGTARRYENLSLRHDTHNATDNKGAHKSESEKTGSPNEGDANHSRAAPLSTFTAHDSVLNNEFVLAFLAEIHSSHPLHAAAEAEERLMKAMALSAIEVQRREEEEWLASQRGDGVAAARRRENDVLLGSTAITSAVSGLRDAAHWLGGVLGNNENQSRDSDSTPPPLPLPQLVPGQVNRTATPAFSTHAQHPSLLQHNTTNVFNVASTSAAASGGGAGGRGAIPTRSGGGGLFRFFGKVVNSITGTTTRSADHNNSNNDSDTAGQIRGEERSRLHPSSAYVHPSLPLSAPRAAAAAGVPLPLPPTGTSSTPASPSNANSGGASRVNANQNQQQAPAVIQQQQQSYEEFSRYLRSTVSAEDAAIVCIVAYEMVEHASRIASRQSMDALMKKLKQQQHTDQRQKCELEQKTQLQDLDHDERREESTSDTVESQRRAPSSPSSLALSEAEVVEPIDILEKLVDRFFRISEGCTLLLRTSLSKLEAERQRHWQLHKGGVGGGGGTVVAVAGSREAKCHEGMNSPFASPSPIPSQKPKPLAVKNSIDHVAYFADPFFTDSNAQDPQDLPEALRSAIGVKVADLTGPPSTTTAKASHAVKPKTKKSKKKAGPAAKDDSDSECSDSSFSSSSSSSTLAESSTLRLPDSATFSKLKNTGLFNTINPYAAETKEGDDSSSSSISPRTPATRKPANNNDISKKEMTNANRATEALKTLYVLPTVEGGANFASGSLYLEQKQLLPSRVGIHGDTKANENNKSNGSVTSGGNGSATAAAAKIFSKISPFAGAEVSAPTATPCTMCRAHYWDPSITLNQMCEHAFSENLMKCEALREAVKDFIAKCVVECFYGELEAHDALRRCRVRKIRKMMATKQVRNGSFAVVRKSDGGSAKSTSAESVTLQEKDVKNTGDAANQSATKTGTEEDKKEEDKKREEEEEEAYEGLEDHRRYGHVLLCDVPTRELLCSTPTEDKRSTNMNEEDLLTSVAPPSQLKAHTRPTSSPKNKDRRRRLALLSKLLTICLRLQYEWTTDIIEGSVEGVVTEAMHAIQHEARAVEKELDALALEHNRREQEEIQQATAHAVKVSASSAMPCCLEGLLSSPSSIIDEQEHKSLTTPTTNAATSAASAEGNVAGNATVMTDTAAAAERPLLLLPPPLLRRRDVGILGDTYISRRCQRLSTMLVRLAEACTHMISHSVFAKTYRESARRETLRIHKMVDKAAINQCHADKGLEGGKLAHLDASRGGGMGITPSSGASRIGDELSKWAEGKAPLKASEIVSAISRVLSPVSYNRRRFAEHELPFLAKARRLAQTQQKALTSRLGPDDELEGSLLAAANAAAVESFVSDHYAFLPNTSPHLLAWMVECEVPVRLAMNAERRDFATFSAELLIGGDKQQKVSPPTVVQLDAGWFEMGGHTDEWLDNYMVQSDHRMTPLRALYVLTLITSESSNSQSQAPASFVGKASSPGQPFSTSADLISSSAFTGISVFNQSVAKAVEHQFAFALHDSLRSASVISAPPLSHYSAGKQQETNVRIPAASVDRLRDTLLAANRFLIRDLQDDEKFSKWISQQERKTGTQATAVAAAEEFFRPLLCDDYHNRYSSELSKLGCSAGDAPQSASVSPPLYFPSSSNVFSSRTLIPVGAVVSPFLFYKCVLLRQGVFKTINFHARPNANVVDNTTPEQNSHGGVSAPEHHHPYGGFFSLTETMLDVILGAPPALTEILRYSLIGTCGLGNRDFTASGEAARDLLSLGVGRRILGPVSFFIVSAVDRLAYRSAFPLKSTTAMRCMLLSSSALRHRSLQGKAGESNSHSSSIAPSSSQQASPHKEERDEKEGSGTNNAVSSRHSQALTSWLLLALDHADTFQADCRVGDEASKTAPRAGVGDESFSALIHQRIVEDGSAVLVTRFDAVQQQQPNACTSSWQAPRSYYCLAPPSQEEDIAVIVNKLSRCFLPYIIEKDSISSALVRGLRQRLLSSRLLGSGVQSYFTTASANHGVTPTSSALHLRDEQSILQALSVPHDIIRRTSSNPRLSEDKEGPASPTALLPTDGIASPRSTEEPSTRGDGNNSVCRMSVLDEDAQRLYRSALEDIERSHTMTSQFISKMLSQSVAEKLGIEGGGGGGGRAVGASNYTYSGREGASLAYSHPIALKAASALPGLVSEGLSRGCVPAFVRASLYEVDVATKRSTFTLLSTHHWSETVFPKIDGYDGVREENAFIVDNLLCCGKETVEALVKELKSASATVPRLSPPPANSFVDPNNNRHQLHDHHYRQGGAQSKSSRLAALIPSNVLGKSMLMFELIHALSKGGERRRLQWLPRNSFVTLNFTPSSRDRRRAFELVVTMPMAMILLAVDAETTKAAAKDLEVAAHTSPYSNPHPHPNSATILWQRALVRTFASAQNLIDGGTSELAALRRDPEHLHNSIKNTNAVDGGDNTLGFVDVSGCNTALEAQLLPCFVDHLESLIRAGVLIRAADPHGATSGGETHKCTKENRKFVQINTNFSRPQRKTEVILLRRIAHNHRGAAAAVSPLPRAGGAPAEDEDAHVALQQLKKEREAERFFRNQRILITILRILKSRVVNQAEGMPHPNLISEVVVCLQGDFVPDIASIKKAIEILIDEKGLVERVGDSNAYRYVTT